MTSNEGVGGLCNPPFVHALASIDGDVPGEAGRLLAAARGDGAVDIFDFSLESGNSKKSSHPPTSKKRASVSNATSNDVKKVNDIQSPSHSDDLVPGRKRHLHLGIGGHASSVNHVYVTIHPLNLEKYLTSFEAHEPQTTLILKD